MRLTQTASIRILGGDAQAAFQKTAAVDRQRLVLIPKPARAHAESLGYLIRPDVIPVHIEKESLGMKPLPCEHTDSFGRKP